jgi:hypothetical protein
VVDLEEDIFKDLVGFAGPSSWALSVYQVDVVEEGILKLM